MASQQVKPLVWARCRGRDGWNSPMDVRPDMATEALNWDFYEGSLGSKRNGSTSAGTLTGMSGINALYRFVPGQDETAAQLILVDNAATNTIRRMAASSTVSAALTLPDNIAANDTTVSFATLNGKCYVAYDGSTNRLKVFDPDYSTTAIRYVGIKASAAATVANTGAGTYAATLRYYKVAFTEQRSSVTVRRANLSASVSFTPSGTGTHARVTKPTNPGEGETHWELYGSADDGTYYLLATTAIGTTTFDDNTAPADYDENEAEPVAGSNTPWPSVKFLHSDGKRLFGLGVWETSAGDSLAPKAGRVFFSPVLDSSGIHDDERVSNTTSQQGWIDLGRNAGGTDRAISGLGNLTYCFQSKGIYMLVATENAEVPFRRVTVSTQLGAVSHTSVVQAEDEQGRPALYFLDPELGPYRISANGMQWIGKAVKDVWDTINLAASNVVAHAVYYKAKNQIWWWIATGASNDPDTILVFDVSDGPAGDGIFYGWSKWTGSLAAARCSVMFSDTIGATMSRALKPYAGLSSGTVLLEGDTTATDDNATNFQGYIQSPAFVADPFNKTLVRSHIHAEVATGVTVTQTLIRNMGDDTDRTATVLLTAAGSETEVLKTFTDAALAEAYAFQVRLGDGSALDSGMTLNRWYADIETRESR
jgi:hypothetical protein